MRTIIEVAEDIKSILNNIERTEECNGETLVDINELVDEILSINANKQKIVYTTTRNPYLNRPFINKLEEYEDAEEKGLLLRLPCNAGDPAYRINPGAMNPIIEMMVQTIAIRHHVTSGKSVCLFCNDLKDLNESYYLEKAFGNDVFFTIEEAEAALKKMQEGEE